MILVRSATTTASPQRWRFTATAYHRLVDVGVLREDDRVELLDGDIVVQERIDPLHASCIARTSHVMIRRLGDRAMVRVRSPIVLGRYSEPEPDVAIVAARADFYCRAHPRSRDTLLAIEFVALRGSYDRTLKLPLYAKAELREVWLVDLKTGTIEVHRRPALRGYRSTETFGRGQAIRPVAFPRMRVRVNEILG